MTAPSTPALMRPPAAVLALMALTACSGEEPDPAPAPPRPAVATVLDDLGAHAPVRTFAGETVAFSQLMAPAGADGRIIGDVESQTGAALRLLAEALEAEGLTLADIAQLTVHVTTEPDGALDAAGVARAWTRSFGNRMQPAAPARTIVGVAALPGGARVSLSALAVRPVPAHAPRTPE